MLNAAFSFPAFSERIGAFINLILRNGADMKVVAFNGSARRGGNTAILLGHTLRELKKEGIETELVELGGAEIHGCLACRKCSTKKNRRCSQKNDMGNVCIEKMDAADGRALP
jgi:multimeric flavodoxin WrbA